MQKPEVDAKVEAQPQAVGPVSIGAVALDTGAHQATEKPKRMEREVSVGDLPASRTAPPTGLKTPPTTGTIRLARKGQSLNVDGKRVNGSIIEVSCGPHIVAVGKEKPRKVDAVCGRTLLVDAGKATLVDETKAAHVTHPHHHRASHPSRFAGHTKH